MSAHPCQQKIHRIGIKRNIGGRKGTRNALSIRQYRGMYIHDPHREVIINLKRIANGGGLRKGCPSPPGSELSAEPTRRRDWERPMGAHLPAISQKGEA